MTTSTVSSKCTAKDRSTCRFHGELDHATMDLDTAKQAYDSKVAELREQGATERTIIFAADDERTQLSSAQAAYDSLPTPYKKLKKDYAKAAQDFDVETVYALQDRLDSATELVEKRDAEKAAAKKRERIAASQKVAYDKWKASDESKPKPGEPVWRTELKKNAGLALVERGEFSQEYDKAYHAWISTNPAETADLKAHVASCGIQNVEGLYEDTDVETQMGYYGDETYVTTQTKANVTCNCGQLFKKGVTYNSSLYNLLDYNAPGKGHFS